MYIPHLFWVVKFTEQKIPFCPNDGHSICKKIAVILHRNPHSGLIQAHIGSDGTDGTASRLSMVEETGVPGENHRQQWVKTKTPQPWPGIEPRPAG